MDPMNAQPSDTNYTPPSKVHTWMLILLTWIAVFSIVIVGILLTKRSDSTLSATDLSAACQNGTINGITTNLTRISEACNAESAKAPTNATGTPFQSSDTKTTLPELLLPEGWTASVFENNARDTTMPLASFSATKGISFNCNECGGVRAPASFFIESDDIAKAATLGDPGINGVAGSMDVATLQTEYAKNPTRYTGITVTSESIASGTLVHIDGTFVPDGVVAHAGPFHILRFANATKAAELTFYEDQGATAAEWLIVKNSLNWASVK